jgi:hypothetical protein
MSSVSFIANGFPLRSSKEPDGDKAMKTTQAWGWLTAGVLALGLNGFYQDGGAVWAHRTVDQVVGRIADRSEAVLALASGRADWFLAKANLVTSRDEAASCRLATAVARMQTRMARAQSGMAGFEAMSARQEADFARLEANRARLEAQAARFSSAAFDPARIRVICPRVRVEIPRVDIPLVRMGDGPI